MTRKHLRMIVLAALLCVIGLAASTASLRAQNQKCSKYTVEVIDIKDSCLPIKVTTAWSTGFDVFVIAANGIYVRPVPPPSPPPPDFKWVSLDGGITTVPLDQQGKYLDPNTGCCFLITVKLDANGCIHITIEPCP